MGILQKKNMKKMAEPHYLTWKRKENMVIFNVYKGVEKQQVP